MENALYVIPVGMAVPSSKPSSNNEKRGLRCGREKVMKRSERISRDGLMKRS